MESLRPDRDEVDNFQRNRQAGKGSKKNTPSVPTESHTVAREAVPKPASNVALWLVVVLMIVGGAALGWVYNEQRQQIDALNAELSDALAFVRQSKLLMARFEGQLSETGAELEETDTVAQEKLKFLDSEVRKLWGVAYDRNRKAIADNSEALKQQTSVLGGVVAENKKQAEKVSGLNKAIDKQSASIQVQQAELLALKSSNEELAAHIKQVEDASSGAISTIRGELAKLEERTDIDKRVKQTEVAIEAIDASRLQLNERLVALERRINDIQLSIRSLNATTPSVIAP